MSLKLVIFVCPHALEMPESSIRKTRDIANMCPDVRNGLFPCQKRVVPMLETGCFQVGNRLKLIYLCFAMLLFICRIIVICLFQCVFLLDEGPAGEPLDTRWAGGPLGTRWAGGPLGMFFFHQSSLVRQRAWATQFIALQKGMVTCSFLPRYWYCHGVTSSSWPFAHWSMRSVEGW